MEWEPSVLGMSRGGYVPLAEDPDTEELVEP